MARFHGAQQVQPTTGQQWERVPYTRPIVSVVHLGSKATAMWCTLSQSEKNAVHHLLHQGRAQKHGSVVYISDRMMVEFDQYVKRM